MHIVSSPELQPLANYRTRYRLTHDYQNVYSVDVRGDTCVVRPDSLAAMVPLAAVDPGVSQVNPRPIFRAETTDPSPLIRDKHLWGVVQAVTQAPAEDPDGCWQQHATLVLDVMTSIRLPTLLVAAPPLRQHADRRLLTFSLTPDGRMWLTSTLYQLTDTLTRPMGATGRVIELGLTGKLVALAVTIHADHLGPLLPASLCPEHLLLGDVPANTDPGSALRVTEPDRRPWLTLVKQCRREGIPLALGARVGNGVGAGYLRATDCFIPAAELLNDLEQALRAHDDLLWQRAIHVQRALSTPDADGGLGTSPRSEQEHVLGRVIDANFPLGRDAADQGLQLLSRKRRLY